MSFSASAQNFWLEGGHILVANVADRDGNWVESRIDLNDFIGNEDGWFMWDGVSKYIVYFLNPESSLPTTILFTHCRMYFGLGLSIQHSFIYSFRRRIIIAI